jgi:PAS domain-containing protein
MATADYEDEASEAYHTARNVMIALVPAVVLMLGLLFGMLEASRRREGEQSTRLEERSRFEVLVEHSSDLITIVDAAGLVTYASPSVARLLGGSTEDYLGT